MTQTVLNKKRTIWNKGLTKETDLRIKAYSEKRTGIKTERIPKTAFKKGCIPWNKNKKLHYKVWNKNLTKETDERVRKIAEERKKYCEENKDLITKILCNRKSWKLSEETISKMKGNQNAKGHQMTLEGKERWLKARLEYLSTCQNRFRNTSIEIAIDSVLRQRNFIEKKDYFRNYPLLNMFNVDFYFPKEKIVIECDGDYWHRREDIKIKDQHKNKILKENGYSLYRFWESQIKKSPEKCLNKISF